MTRNRPFATGKLAESMKELAVGCGGAAALGRLRASILNVLVGKSMSRA